MNRRHGVASVEDRALENGIPVIACEVVGSPVTTVAAVARLGSRDEPDELAGITHVLEHIFLEATIDSTEPLAKRVERRGGEPNGLTSREDLTFIVQAPKDEGLEMLRLLAGGLTRTLSSAELDAHLRVVGEEISQYRADPRLVAREAAYAELFPNTGLDRPIIGTVATIARLNVGLIAEYWHQRVHSGTLAVIVVGAVTIDEVLHALEDSPLPYLRRGTWEPTRRTPARTRGAVSAGTHTAAVATDSAHVLLAAPGVDFAHPARAALEVVATALGGSTSAALYREIRSRLGLAYGLWAEHMCLTDCGLFCCDITTTPASVANVTAVAERVIQDRLAAGWTEEETTIARIQCRSQFIFACESSFELALLLCQHRHTAHLATWTPEAHARAISDVTHADVLTAGQRFLRGGFCCFVAGGVAAPPPSM